MIGQRVERVGMEPSGVEFRGVVERAGRLVRTCEIMDRGVALVGVSGMCIATEVAIRAVDESLAQREQPVGALRDRDALCLLYTSDAADE